MKKNRRFKILIYSCIILSSLVGCDFRFNTSTGRITLTPVTSSSSSQSLGTSELGSSSSIISSSIDDELGYVTGPLKYNIHDFIPTTTPSEGEVDILVVPIDLSTAKDANRFSNKLNNWEIEDINFIEKNYCSNQGQDAEVTNDNNVELYYPSFKNYYQDVSYGKVSVNIKVTPIYEVSNSTSLQNITESVEDYTPLYNLFDEACKYVQENDSSITRSKFDRNNDGAFDSIHFVTNFKGAEWNDVLWPHMAYTGLNSKSSYIVPNVYSLSSIEHFTNALTAIHEQGHMFGLQDYYSYSQESEHSRYLPYDFVGGCDMQDDNSFDWNTYSKLVTGWANPTVITGSKDSCEVTLSASSINGDCLIVPANYGTFNNSPFDEYFLFELFSIEGENKVSGRKINEVFYYLNEDSVLPKYGVRAYYVNGSLYKEKNGNKSLIDEPVNYNEYDIGQVCNNSNNATDYGEGIDSYNNIPLISLISRGDSSKYTKRRDNIFNTSSPKLSKEDLFKEGDVFTFFSASGALRKGGQKVEKMNNNETWPYKLTFVSMDSDSVTVKVEKI